MNDIIPESGAIAFRTDSPEVQILLIRSRKQPQHWIFPKGHIEPGESETDASRRELLEEAGVEGEPLAYAGILEFTLDEKAYRVSYYFNRFIRSAGTGEAGRDPQWCSIKDALSLLSFPATRDMLHNSLPALSRITGCKLAV